MRRFALLDIYERNGDLPCTTNSRYRSESATCGTKKGLRLKSFPIKQDFQSLHSARMNRMTQRIFPLCHYAVGEVLRCNYRLLTWIVGAKSSRRYIKRLLRELISHEEFPRLLADIEIYIDNIAGMHDSSRQSFAPYGILTHGLTFVRN